MKGGIPCLTQTRCLGRHAMNAPSGMSQEIRARIAEQSMDVSLGVATMITARKNLMERKRPHQLAASGARRKRPSVIGAGV